MTAPAHGVWLQKYEDGDTGGDAGDTPKFGTNPLEAGEDAPYVQGVYFLAPGTLPGVFDKLVYMTRDGSGNLVFKDVANGSELTLADLVAGAGGLTAEQHKTLRQGIHFVDGGPAEGFTSGATRTTAGGLFPTLIEWKTAGGDLIYDKAINGPVITPSPIVQRVYDTDGTTVLVTLSDAITYSGIAETSRVRTITI